MYRANARLIAASPTLLEALEHIDTYTTRQANESPEEAALWAQCASFARAAIEAANS